MAGGFVGPLEQRRAGRLALCVFPKQKRLVVEQDGKLTQYDTGEHRISGVSQQSSTAAPKFSSESGEVDAGALKQVG